jgi:hypothetical protein
MSDDGIVTDELVTTAGGPQYVDGVLMTFGADPRLLPDSKAVVDEFRKRHRAGRLHPVRLRVGPDPGRRFNGAKSNKGEDAAKWLKATRSRPSWARSLGQQGRPESVRLRGLPVGQETANTTSWKNRSKG